MTTPLTIFNTLAWKCHQKMADVEYCMESHRKMTAARYECAAEVQLERMERMSLRLNIQWQQMRDTWHRHDIATDDTATLIEIAEVVTRTGATVEEILHTSRQFAKTHLKTEPIIIETLSMATNRGNDIKKTRQHDARRVEGVDNKERLQYNAQSR
jgi:hypothetical protein